MTSDLVLYGYWRSSAAYRVRIALNLKGLAYESRPAHQVHRTALVGQPSRPTGHSIRRNWCRAWSTARRC